jgi:dihydrodipicolinate reductase
MVSRLNSLLAAYMLLVPGYKVSIEEIHHTAKLDSPSGTAIMLSDKIITIMTGYNWLDRMLRRRRALYLLNRCGKELFLAHIT